VLAEGDLVSQGLPVVQTVSRSLARRLGGHVPLDDLTGIGNLALLDVARTYDPSRATFAAYAAQRLRWAILDGLRRETHVRSTASRASALMASERLADVDASADPGAPEAAEPTTVEDDRAALGGLLAGHAAALAVGLLASPPDPLLVDSPEEEVQRAELAHLVRGIVGALPDRERALIERHYYGGEAFDAIARDLGISKSWASRLHERAILAVKQALEDPTRLPP
jgi:RNA polymerase sigma factor for flagellar operon FliA